MRPSAFAIPTPTPGGACLFRTARRPEFVGSGKSLRIGVNAAPIPVDNYAVTLAAGVPATFTLNTDAVGMFLKLYTADGVLLAADAPHLGVQQIREFLPSASGTYYIEVGGARNADYAVNIVQGAVFTPPRGMLDPLVELAVSDGAVGWIEGSSWRRTGRSASACMACSARRR